MENRSIIQLSIPVTPFRCLFCNFPYVGGLPAHHTTLTWRTSLSSLRKLLSLHLSSLACPLTTAHLIWGVGANVHLIIVPPLPLLLLGNTILTGLVSSYPQAALSAIISLFNPFQWRGWLPKPWVSVTGLISSPQVGEGRFRLRGARRSLFQVTLHHTSQGL
jgi:hypothetical protein